MFRWLFATSLVVAVSLSAHCGRIWVDALYWRPTNLPTATSVSADAAGGQVLHALQPDSGWGVRAGRRHATCLSVTYSGLYFGESSAASFSPLGQVRIVDLLFGIDSSPSTGANVGGFVRAQQTTTHWNLDLRLGWGADLFDFLFVEGVAGGRYVNHYAKLTTQETLSGDGGSLQLDGHRRAHFSGGGPLLGLHIDVCPFYCGVGLRAHLLGLMVIGQSQTSYSARGFGNFLPLTISLPHATLLIPGTDFEVAVSYDYLCWQVEVGYALQHYWNFLREFTVGPVLFESPWRQTGGGVSGPFLSLKVTY